MGKALRRRFVGAPGREPAAGRHRSGEEKLSRYRDEKGNKTEDSVVDGMSEDSFPASDPPSYSGTRAGPPKCDRSAEKPGAKSKG